MPAQRSAPNRSLASRLAVLAMLAFPFADAPARADETPSQASPELRDALAVADVWIREEMAWRQVPGLALAVVHGGETIWKAGYGVADLATGAPVTPSTRFRVGSVSKLFTSTAILVLRDEGKLSLDDPIAKHLPWFRPTNPYPTAPTVEHLLTHTTGLPRDTTIPYWTTHDFPTAAAVRASMPGLTLLSPPGETYRYSNVGIALLGEIVAAAAGEPWERFVERRILSPLGMTSSAANLAPDAFPTLARAYLHRRPDGSRGEAPHYETRAISPAASVVSTAEDLAKFAAFELAASGPARPGDPLSPETRREMQRARFVYPSWSGGRGLGFAVSRRDGRTYVSHGGWIGGHRTDFLLDPGRDLAVVAFTNADDASPLLFSRKILDLVGAALAKADARANPPRAPVADPDWNRFVGRYTDPWEWEYEVLVLDGRLVFYEHDYPPADEPDASLVRLTPTGKPGEFRMDDGEPVVFETDAAGKVTRIRRRYEFLTPVTTATPPPG